MTFSLRTWLIIIGTTIIILMFFLQFKNSRSKTNKIKKTFSVQDANTPAYTKHTPSQQSLDKASNHSIHSTDKYIHGNHPVNHLQDNSMDNTTRINGVNSIENDSSHSLDTTTNDENNFVKDKIVNIYLRHTEKLFDGYHLIETLQKHGLEYAEMNIFHYKNLHKETLFSVANAISPGTLVPTEMNDFSTPAITLFLDIQQHNPLEAFNLMLKKAEAIAKDLNAQIFQTPTQLFTQAIKERYISSIEAVTNFQ